MSTDVVSPLRQRMIEDMNARKLGAHSQRSHIYSCKQFAAFLKRAPDTATPDDVRRFQLHLAETGMSICNRNRIMTGVKFLFRVTLRRLDLVAEIYHLREPQKIPLVMSPDETKRLLAVASSLKARILLGLGYGCGLRASEVVRLKVKHIDSAQKIIRIEQSKGRKDRNVMLSAETLDLLRQWPVRSASDSDQFLCEARNDAKGAISGREQSQQGRPYSITSSASASNLSGISRPSTFAVSRLITNSKWVGCKTGSSAGFAPLRICATYSPAWRYIQLMLGP